MWEISSAVERTTDNREVSGSNPLFPIGDLNLQVLYPITLIMSTKLLALAADIAEENPAGSQLIISLTQAENGYEIVEALDAYDDELNYETYNVYEDDEDYVNPDEEVVSEEEVENTVNEEYLVTV